MYALVCMTDSMDGIPHGGHCVWVFPTEAEAVEFAVKELVECGEVEMRSEGGWDYDGDDYATAEGVLEAYQDSLGMTEYFHVKPVVDAG